MPEISRLSDRKVFESPLQLQTEDVKAKKKTKKINESNSSVKLIKGAACLALLAYSSIWLYQRSSYGGHSGCYRYFEGKPRFGDQLFCKTVSAGWGVADEVLKPQPYGIRSLQYFPDEFRDDRKFVEMAIDRLGWRAINFANSKLTAELDQYTKDNLIKNLSKDGFYGDLTICPSNWRKDRKFMERVIDKVGWEAISFIDSALLEIPDFNQYAQEKMLKALTPDNVGKCPNEWKSDERFMKQAIDLVGWQAINVASHELTYKGDVAQYAQDKMLQTVNKGDSLFIFRECPNFWLYDKKFMEQAIDRLGWEAVTWAAGKAAGDLTQYAQDKMLQEIHKEETYALHKCPTRWKESKEFMKRVIDRAGWQAIKFASRELQKGGELAQYAQNKMFEELGTKQSLPDDCRPEWAFDKQFMIKVHNRLGQAEAVRFFKWASPFMFREELSDRR